MSHGDRDDPRCPECDEPIGMTAAYCMFCSADLTAQKARADTDDDGFWDDPETTDASTTAGEAVAAGTRIDASPAAGDGRASVTDAVSDTAPDDGGLFAADGVVDNALTAVVGLAGGLVVGLVGTTVLLILTGSGWGVGVGIVAWLAATVHLVRRRTVRDAVARTAYAVSLVLLLVPFVAFGPSSETTELGTRVVVFAAMLAGVAVPAAVAAGFGFAVSRFRLGSEAE